MNNLIEIYPNYNPKCKEIIDQTIYLDRRNIINFVVTKGEMGEDYIPNILAQIYVKERWN